MYMKYRVTNEEDNMRAVVQRVKRAEVRVEGSITGKIETEKNLLEYYTTQKQYLLRQMFI